VLEFSEDRLRDDELETIEFIVATLGSDAEDLIKFMLIGRLCFFSSNCTGVGGFSFFENRFLLPASITSTTFVRSATDSLGSEEAEDIDELSSLVLLSLLVGDGDRDDAGENVSSTFQGILKF